MIILPVHPRRALLTSFWLVASVGSGVAAGVCVWLLGRPGGLTVGAALAGAAGLVGMLWPQLVWFAYRAWNWAARRLTDGGRAALLRICYFVVLLATGKRGGRFSAESSKAAGSLWMSHETLPPEAYMSPFDALSGRAAPGGWMRGYIRWAVKGNNLWAIVLLPFLALIAALEEAEEPALPATIYTLF